MRCIHLRVPVGMWTDLDHHFPCIVCIHNSRKPKSPLEPEIYSNISYAWDAVFALLPFMQPALLFFRKTEWAHRYRNFAVTYIPSWWGDPGDNRNNPEVSATNNNDDNWNHSHILRELLYNGNIWKKKVNINYLMENLQAQKVTCQGDVWSS